MYRFPRFGCLFCDQHFHDLPSLNSHHDTYLSEFTTACRLPPETHSLSSHPDAIIRYIRSTAPRNPGHKNPAIVWNPITHRPIPGGEWNIVVPIVSLLSILSLPPRTLHHSLHPSIAPAIILSFVFLLICLYVNQSTNTLTPPPPAARPPPASAFHEPAHLPGGRLAPHPGRHPRSPTAFHRPNPYTYSCSCPPGRTPARDAERKYIPLVRWRQRPQRLYPSRRRRRAHRRGEFFNSFPGLVLGAVANLGRFTFSTGCKDGGQRRRTWRTTWRRR